MTQESRIDSEQILHYNRAAWDAAVRDGSEWTVPVSPEQVAAARQGDWRIVLTPSKPVPREWFPDDLNNVNVLCLASGGGQQGPILAAASANVTVFDNSPAQLARDVEVAEREQLSIRTVQGDMADLSEFDDNEFELIVHPTSNLFVPNVRPVWREAYRVLKPRGRLLSGFVNPVLYIFDQLALDDGELRVRHSIPYSDLTSISAEERRVLEADDQPYEFGHTLQDQIGGQLEAGFVLTGYYDDTWPGTTLEKYIATFAATLAVKLEL